MALVDYFLKLDGIDGSSDDKEFTKWIEVTSWSWGETQSGDFSSGGGGGAGKVNLQDFHFVAKFDKSSPVLFLSCATGKHIKSGILIGRNNRAGAAGGGGGEQFIKMTLGDVLVSSYQTGAVTDSLPTDQVSLNFAKIEIQDAGFDSRTNTGA